MPSKPDRFNQLARGVFLAPLLGTFCALAYVFGLAPWQPHIIYITLVFGVIFGWPAMLIVGLPLHHFLSEAEASSVVAYAIAGTFAGLLYSLFAAALLLGDLGGWGTTVSLVGGVAGFVTATTFYLLTGCPNAR